MIDAFAGLDTFENPWKFVRMVARYQDLDRPSENFCGGISVDTLRPPVPAQDRSVELLGDDGVVGRLDDGGEEAGGLVVWVETRVVHRTPQRIVREVSLDQIVDSARVARVRTVGRQCRKSDRGQVSNRARLKNPAEFLSGRILSNSARPMLRLGLS